MGAGRLKLAVDSTRERDYINSQITAANDAIQAYQDSTDTFRAGMSFVTDLLPLPPEIEAIGTAVASYAYWEGTEDERDAIGGYSTNLTDIGADDVTYTNVHTGEESGGPRFYKQSRESSAADIDRALDSMDSQYLQGAMIDTVNAYTSAGGELPGSTLSEAELKLAGVDEADYSKFGSGSGEYQYMGQSGNVYESWLGYFGGELGNAFGGDFGTDIDDIQ